MKKHNIYKYIVWIFLFCFLVSKGIGWGRDYAEEQKTYGFHIQADDDLTADIIDEFRKISGILSFDPADTAAVTIELGNYTLQTEMIGFDLNAYPLKWKQLSGGSKSGTATAAISMGNTPVLFFGAEVFSSFADRSGYPPLKSQVEKWMDQYQTLELTVMDESGRERKAKICGILSWPEDKVCMDKSQMKDVFGSFSHTDGGFLKIYGHTNMENACELLENAGFVIQEISSCWSRSEQ